MDVIEELPPDNSVALSQDLNEASDQDNILGEIEGDAIGGLFGSDEEDEDSMYFAYLIVIGGIQD